MFKLSRLAVNPKNPRKIKDTELERLKKSIEEFPGMMELRPIIYDEDGYILGGNMRFQALLGLKYKEVPESWVKSASALTDEEKNRFIIADNISFGDYDWDKLATDWDAEDLEKWGMNVPKSWKELDPEDDEPKPQPDKSAWFLNIRCDSEEQAQELYEKFIEDGLDVKIVL